MQASLLDTDQFGQTSAGGARAKPVLRAEPSAGSIRGLPRTLSCSRVVYWAALTLPGRGRNLPRGTDRSDSKGPIGQGLCML